MSLIPKSQTKPSFMAKPRKANIAPKKIKKYLKEDALPLMYVEWLKTDDSQPTVVSRWVKRVVNPKGLRAMFVRYCTKAGGKKAKAEIKHIKKDAIVEAKKRSYEEVKEAVKNLQVESALGHAKFIDRTVKKAVKTVDKLPFDENSISSDLGITKQVDDIARKAFGMDQLTEEAANDSGRQNLAILINFEPQEKEVPVQVIEDH